MLLRVADRLRVLGQVVRLRLVEQLRAGESTPRELADTLGLSQQHVSKHLQVLHRSGVEPRSDRQAPPRGRGFGRTEDQALARSLFVTVMILPFTSRYAERVPRRLRDRASNPL
jgi:predicted transcriptional regulator